MEHKANTGSTAVETAEKATASAKQIGKSKLKAPREKSMHPSTSEMVTAAIKELKDRKGSSLQAIKKYIGSTYKVDGEKFAPFLKRYLKSSVTSGAIVQTKGKGASRSFKLSTGQSSEGSKAKKSLRPLKKAAPKKAQSVQKKTVSKKSAAIKKPAQPKKHVTEKEIATPKKTAAKSTAKSKAAIQTKSISKVKKSTKAPAAKTKTPKPKKAMASKAVKSTTKK